MARLGSHIPPISSPKLAGQEQAADHPDRIDGVDHRDHERREVITPLTQRVQRRRNSENPILTRRGNGGDQNPNE
jgi:hypothetical protein